MREQTRLVRELAKLDPKHEKRLAEEANGADKAVQQYFLDRGYRNVTVYCMDRCRNNLGAWPLKHVHHTGGARDSGMWRRRSFFVVCVAGEQARHEQR